MDLVREFGDPDVLVLAEDHIVFKLATAWPRDVAIPKRLSLADDDGLLLIANQRCLVSVAKSGLPRETKISKALFCGCASFESSDRYGSAASKLLRDAEEICIVHNRDKVYKLVRMFPNVKVLALSHDLCTHDLELDEPGRNRFEPLVERSQLRLLIGNAGSVCDGSLHLSRETTLALLRTCPDIRRIDCRWVASCFMQPRGLSAATERPKATSFVHLWLVSPDHKFAFEPPGGTGAVDVALAAKKFPSIEKLQVAVGSMGTLAKVSAFRQLRSLMVGLGPNVAWCDVDSTLNRLLRNLPELEELDLESCGGLQFSTIARLCPKIKRLRLASCMGSMEDTPVDGDAFPNLECVDMNVKVLNVAFSSFLSATRDTLRTARFDGEGACIGFLQYCARNGRRWPFARLEHLTLATEHSLRGLQLDPDDLCDVAKALPALRHLQTDSDDLRMFFENNCVRRGRVSLSRIACAYCKANDPSVAKCEELLALFKLLAPRQ
ncbi:uncharacterized protein [Dermacentor andersoni]|uniref:uncharacterized protein n=1 Tax=Dermacentor andersoni TaxID=34620 RepID=UPI002415AF6E|nr:uncharacterized protein LOC126544767 [Dermacentor andersoni]